MISFKVIIPNANSIAIPSGRTEINFWGNFPAPIYLDKTPPFGSGRCCIEARANARLSFLRAGITLRANGSPKRGLRGAICPHFGAVAAAGDGLEPGARRSEEHTSELQSQSNLVCRLLLEKKKKKRQREI